MLQCAGMEDATSIGSLLREARGDTESDLRDRHGLPAPPARLRLSADECAAMRPHDPPRLFYVAIVAFVAGMIVAASMVAGAINRNTEARLDDPPPEVIIE